MATTTTNFGWDIPQSTDLVKDGATAIATLGQDIDTAFVDLKGGTTGQVLTKNSGTDLDFVWAASDDTNAIQNTIIDAKGDLIVGTAADTPARLPIGSNGYVLTADSAETAGVKWAAAASGGGMTLLSTTSLSGSSTSVSITPTGYQNIQVVVSDFQLSGNGAIYVRINGANTDPNYAGNGTYMRAYDYNYAQHPTSGTQLIFGNYDFVSGNNNNFAVFNSYDVNNTSIWRSLDYFIAGGQTTNAAYSLSYNGSISIADTGALSSFDFRTNSTFSGGTIKIYGVK